MASMPADRSQALKILQQHNGIITAKELSEEYERSYKTSKRLLDELCGLKVIRKISGSGSIASDYLISEEFRDFICLSTSEFLSTHSGKTKTPQSSENTNHSAGENLKDDK